MSSDLEKVQMKLREIALAENGPDAIRIIDKLSKEVESLKTELMYERQKTPNTPTDAQIAEFKEKFYDSLKEERATDLAISYSKSELASYRPATRLAIVQVLVTIAKEQKVKVPAVWQRYLDSRGHD